MANHPLHKPIIAWFDQAARDLPWRDHKTTPWGVLVSEFMLQQTPVSRVLEPYTAWLARWPTPTALAADSPGEAVRMWGRLGYPRRALRLHQAATAISHEHGGEVPNNVQQLSELPGVGDYTAAAVAAFGYGQRVAVLDTNVRRVFARLLSGRELVAAQHITKAERKEAERLLPSAPPEAATWSIGVMELGALICTAVAPACPRCPVADQCRWRAEGSPTYDGPPRRAQTYAGTDRQCRGRLLAVLRDADGEVPAYRLDLAWNNPEQRSRCLASLIADGLAIETTNGFALPT
jgi:A/G-specific adenine glycosylase